MTIEMLNVFEVFVSIAADMKESDIDYRKKK